MKLRVGDLAVGRAGDKGSVLDLTLVAHDEHSYELLVQRLDEHTVARLLRHSVPGPVRRYTVPALHAIKYVAPNALPGGVYASLHPGLHWQKAAIWLLLDLCIEGAEVNLPKEACEGRTNES